MAQVRNKLSGRMLYLLNELGYNKNSFAKRAGFTNNVTIGKVTTGDTVPNYATLERIAIAFPEINLNWLITGNGEPFLSSQHTSKSSESYKDIIQENNNTLKQTNNEKCLQSPYYGEKILLKLTSIERLLQTMSRYASNK